MITTIIALLMSLGILGSPADMNNMTAAEKQTVIENNRSTIESNGIIIADITGL